MGRFSPSSGGSRWAAPGHLAGLALAAVLAWRSSRGAASWVLVATAVAASAAVIARLRSRMVLRLSRR